MFKRIMHMLMTIPSSLTTRGMESWISLQAAMMPLAIVAQFTIPPNMFTSIAFTWTIKKSDTNELVSQPYPLLGSIIPLLSISQPYWYVLDINLHPHPEIIWLATGKMSPTPQADLWVSSEQLECLEHLSLIDSTTYIQEVGWLPFVKFDDVHGSHG